MAERLYDHGIAARTLRGSVGDLRQIASVRRIMLDDGPERGVRALAFSTGAGLDFWVLTDRSFDIGPLWFRGMPVAWQGPNGFRSPALHDAADDDGQGFTRSLSGLLVTCGLDHTRQPSGGKPLHGRLPFTPGRLLSYGEDWRRGEPILCCEGEVTQARLGGEAVRLHRRIEAPIGGTTLRIVDEVEDLGAEAQRKELLYHFNLGYPAIREGTRILLDSDLLAGPLTAPDPAAESSVVCHPVRNREGRCTITTPMPDGNGSFALQIGFDKGALPFLQLWQDLRPHHYLVGVEPCTSDRNADGTSRLAADVKAGSLTAQISLSLSAGS